MKILTLNGGGTGGYGTAKFLAELEARLGRPLHEEFDLISGISTGSLIGAALACGLSAERVVDFYEKWVPVIFKKRPWWKFWAGVLSPEYDIENLKKAVIDVLGDGSLDSKAKTKYMTYALQVHKSLKPKFWKSWMIESGSEDVVDMCVASSAAPAYFKPYEVDGDFYLDGGLLSTDPSMCAFAEAVELGNKPDEIKIVNIRVGAQNGYPRNEADDVQGFLWLFRLPSAFLSGGQRMVEYQCKAVMKDNYRLIDLAIDDELDEWGSRFKNEVNEKVKDAIHFDMQDIIEFLGNE